VLDHPAPLRGLLARPELTVGVEKRRVQDRYGIDGAPVALRELRKLGPGEVGVGRFVVEVEPDRRGCRAHASLPRMDGMLTSRAFGLIENSGRPATNVASRVLNASTRSAHAGGASVANAHGNAGTE